MFTAYMYYDQQIAAIVQISDLNDIYKLQLSVCALQLRYEHYFW